MQQPDDDDNDDTSDTEEIRYALHSPTAVPQRENEYEVHACEGEDSAGTMRLSEVAYDRDKKWCRCATTIHMFPCRVDVSVRVSVRVSVSVRVRGRMRVRVRVRDRRVDGADKNRPLLPDAKYG